LKYSPRKCAAAFAASVLAAVAIVPTGQPVQAQGRGNPPPCEWQLQPGGQMSYKAGSVQLFGQPMPTMTATLRPICPNGSGSAGCQGSIWWAVYYSPAPGLPYTVRYGSEQAALSSCGNGTATINVQASLLNAADGYYDMVILFGPCGYDSEGNVDCDIIDDDVQWQRGEVEFTVWGSVINGMTVVEVKTEP
jgi:hypothetical protein